MLVLSYLKATVQHLLKSFDSGNITFNGNVTVNGPTTNTIDLNVYRNLVLTGYLSAKPYVSLKVTTSGGTPSTNPSGSTLTLGTPGTVTLTQMGYNTTSVCPRGTPGNSNYFLYTFTWTGAHPLGSNFAVNVVYNTGSSGTAQPTGVITANNNSTSITVWLRATVGSLSNVLQDGNFYVHTVP